MILIKLGLRPGEIFRLKVEDIDWKGFMVRVRSGKSKAAKRELPLIDEVYQALKEWMDRIGRPKKGWLFPSPSYPGKHYSQHMSYDWHHAALEKSGVADFEPYSLRHTALTRLAKSCRNPYAVAKAAGHSSITMTYRYIHPEKEEIWAAFEKVSGNRIGHAARKDMLKVVNADGRKDENPQADAKPMHNIATVADADLISNDDGKNEG